MSLNDLREYTRENSKEIFSLFWENIQRLFQGLQ